MNRKNHASVVRLTSLALLAALVVVLQTVASGIRIGPVPISLTLVPIVVGAILFGPGAGAGLGAVFGIVCLIAGITGADEFTNVLWVASPFWLVVVCVGKAVLCGLCAGLVAKALRQRQTISCILAALTAPVVNTGVFAIGMLTVFKPVLQDYAGELPRGIRCQCGYERRDRTHRAGRAEAAGKINSTPSEWQSAARRGISLYPQNSNRRFKLPALVIKKAPCHALHDKGRRYGNYRTSSASSFLPRRRSMVFFTARKMFW